MNKIFTGALDDTRTEVEKQKDWKHEEIASAPISVEWKEKTTFRTYKQKRQDGSGSCVAQTVSKILGINNELDSGVYVDLSAKYIYNHRSNTGSGMMSNDALSLGKDLGAPPEQLCPCQDQNEEQMNDMVDKPYLEESAKIFKAESYFQTPFDIDTIASIIESGKGIMLWFRFFADEWNEAPEIKHTGFAPNHHSVTGVDFTLYRGEKAIVIDDSWGKEYGINGQRIIRESFLRKRITLSAYFVDMKNGKSIGLKPKYVGGQAKHGDKNNIVKNIQECLKYEGLFKNVEPTGLYLGLTSKSVYEFQKKYNVASEQELDSLRGMVFGPKTEQKMLEIYG